MSLKALNTLRVGSECLKMFISLVRFRWSSQQFHEILFYLPMDVHLIKNKPQIDIHICSQNTIKLLSNMRNAVVKLIFSACKNGMPFKISVFTYVHMYVCIQDMPGNDWFHTPYSYMMGVDKYNKTNIHTHVYNYIIIYINMYIQLHTTAMTTEVMRRYVYREREDKAFQVLTRALLLLKLFSDKIHIYTLIYICKDILLHSYV